MYFHSLALQEDWLSPLFFCVTALVERRLLVIVGGMWRRRVYHKRVTRA